jgi:hypothetical protein
MCRLHCVNNGGCSYKTHNTKALSDRQKGKQRAQESYPHTFDENTAITYSQAQGENESLYIDRIIEDFGGPIVRYQAKCREEEEQRDREQRELDAALGLSLSPLPLSVELDQMIAQDDEELQHALCLSESLPPDAGASEGPTQLDRPPTPGADVVASSSNSQATTFTAPRSRIPATSVIQKPPSAPMKITTQMSDSWMRSYIDNTSKSSTTTSQRSGGRRAFADLSVVHRFTLIYWDKVSTLFYRISKAYNLT